MATKPASSLKPCNKLEKVVMVTGASSGIGREICFDLAKAGCKIIALARRLDRLTTLRDQINNSTTDSNTYAAIKAKALELDVTDDGATIKQVVQRAWNAFGHIDVLINNAGIRGTVNSSLNLPEEEWNEVTKTNHKGQWLVAKFVGQLMRDSGEGGSIVNISSIAGLNRTVVPGGVAYSSSKAALDAVTKTMALELGKFNIRVNSIALGLFKSEITDALFKLKGFENMIFRTTPLQELGSADPSLTSLLRYLIHDSTSYVSANIFIVDSGYSLPGFPLFSSL